MNHEPLMVDAEGAAKLLGFSRHSLEARRRRGTGPPFVQFGPSTVRYKVSDLRAWCEGLQTLDRSVAKRV